MKTVIIGRRSSAECSLGISSGLSGNETIILEKMSSCGRKLRITGKGRCNITNSEDISEFIKYIPGNRKVFI